MRADSASTQLIPKLFAVSIRFPVRSANFDRIWPIGARLDQMLAKIGSHVGQFLLDLAEFSQLSTVLFSQIRGPNLAELGPVLANIGQHLTSIWPPWANIGHHGPECAPRCGQCWPTLGRVRPTFINIGPASAQSGQALVEFYHCWANFGKLCQSCPGMFAASR